MTTKDTKTTKESEYKLFDVIFQAGDVEIDQRCDLHTRPLRASTVAPMAPLGARQRSEFNDPFVFDKHVWLVPPIEPHVFVWHQQWALELGSDSVEIRLMGETVLAGGFRQMRPRLSVPSDDTSDLGSRDRRTPAPSPPCPSW